MVRRRFSEQRWAGWIEQQRSSGLSIRQFCDRKGLVENTFYNWRRRLAAEAGPRRRRTTAATAAFLPVDLVDDRHRRIEIELPCGAVVRVPDDLRVTRRVLGVLLRFPGSQS